MDALTTFVAAVLRAHFSAAEIESLIRRLGERPDEIVLRASTLTELVERVAQWFAQRGRIDELLRAVVDERISIARKWAKEMLHRRFGLEQRDDLLRDLGVSPGDVILNPSSDESHAWEIVDYFERRSSLWALIRGIVLRTSPTQATERPFSDLPQLTAGLRG